MALMTYIGGSLTTGCVEVVELWTRKYIEKSLFNHFNENTLWRKMHAMLIYPVIFLA